MFLKNSNILKNILNFPAKLRAHRYKKNFVENLYSMSLSTIYNGQKKNYSQIISRR